MHTHYKFSMQRGSEILDSALQDHEKYDLRSRSDHPEKYDLRSDQITQSPKNVIYRS